MKLVVLGLSLSSSWGNGHATTWRALLRAFAARTYVPAPRSIYRAIFKLPPGTILTLSSDALAKPLSAPPEA